VLPLFVLRSQFDALEQLFKLLSFLISHFRFPMVDALEIAADGASVCAPFFSLPSSFLPFSPSLA
jgi:hypothetical protein